MVYTLERVMEHTYKEVETESAFGDTNLEYICERCGASEGDNVPCRDLYPAQSKLYIEKALKAVAGR